jgi:hypothetical protein
MTIHPIINTPFCIRCDDFYYIRDKRGYRQVCPECSCPKCQRLKEAHPDCGGCICHLSNEDQEAVPAAAATHKEQPHA